MTYIYWPLSRWQCAKIVLAVVGFVAGLVGLVAALVWG